MLSPTAPLRPAKFYSRSHEMGDSPLPAPLQDITPLNEFRARPHTLDLAMVSEQDTKHFSEGFTNLPPLSIPFPPQDYSGIAGTAVDQAGKPGLRRSMYSPYAPDQNLSQWMVPPPAQYRAVTYSAFSTDYSTQAASGPAHGSMADWGQYSLFPYACW